LSVCSTRVSALVASALGASVATMRFAKQRTKVFEIGVEALIDRGFFVHF
jgi:hypothetical protein